MKTLLPLVLLALGMQTAADPPHLPLKQAAVESIEAESDALAELADRIWEYAETALRERRSAAVLSDYLEGKGFRVQRGVAGMPTAFVAEYGSGRPVIGILGEYDALPGLSQKAQPEKEPLEAGAGGHGCGHNLFGPASAGAAVALRELIEAGRLTGTVRFYGTPAEEAVGGKVYMVKAGLFDDVDAALAWHPNTENEADVQSSQAIADFKVDFFGRAAHAAFDPWNGRSALDGADLFIHALNLMREHVKPTVRIHYVIESGGRVPNIVPEEATVWCWVRDSSRAGVSHLLERVKKAAAGAAQATETTHRFTLQAGDYEVLPNRAGGLLMYRNLQWLGPIDYSDEEQEFARTLQRNAGVEPEGLDGSIQPWRETAADPEGGSTDVGDVSWVVPVINMTATTAPVGVPWHGWAVVASGGTSIGHKGMMLAAKSMAATAVDLFADPDALAGVRREFEEKTAGHVYQSFVTADTPPLPADSGN